MLANKAINTLSKSKTINKTRDVGTRNPETFLATYDEVVWRASTVGSVKLRSVCREGKQYVRERSSVDTSASTRVDICACFYKARPKS